MIKTCTICGKEYEAVTSEKTCSAVCKMVHRRRQRKRYRLVPKNIVSERRYNKRYYLKWRQDPVLVEKRREYDRMYYHENREKIVKYMVEYRKGYRARA